jgi:hypothetical protein
MTQLPVTLLTAHAASADQLSEADYRDIYTELRGKSCLDKFVVVIASQVSKAWWSQYERGKAKLTRERRNELRTGVGIAELPVLPSQAVAPLTADAKVWQVGATTPDRAIMVGADVHEPLVLYVNGDLRATLDVTGLTRSVSEPTKPGRVRVRQAWFRPCLSREPGLRLQQLARLTAAAQAEIEALC